MSASLTAPPLPATTTNTLHVASETAPLRQVVVHTPGEEMALVSPENKDALLYDDILFLEVAREEHDAMCRLFRTVVGHDEAVLQIGRLLREVFDEEDARESYVETLIRALPDRNYEAYERELKALDPDALHRFALTGQAPFPITAHPLPNLMFTRDLSAVVGDHLILSHAATPARLPESAIIATVMRHHRRFANARERLIELPERVSFEGGDLLVVSDELVLVGHSERTSLGGVMEVTQALLERTSVRHVLMVNLPKRRACMHLDTVFTFADPETCVVFPPIIEAARNNVYHLEAGDEPRDFRMRVLPSLKVALSEMMDRDYTFIPCGGDDPIAQRREQWTDGANLFALAPGLVVGYARNRVTFDTMEARGYEIIDAEDFLASYDTAPLDPAARIAIKLTGHELSRGRGGPRCMTMPLVREAQP